MSANTPGAALTKWLGRDLLVPILVAIALAVFLSFSLVFMSATDLGAAFSNSLSLSAIAILVALGLAITFGVMRVINMAHGDLMMLGGYTAYIVTSKDYLDLNLFWAMPISFFVVAFVGYLLEVLLIRHLYGRPLDTLLATWGVGILLQQAVLTRFRADLAAMRMPEFLQPGIVIGDLTIPRFRVFIVGITAVCLVLVYLWFYQTSFGLKIRAVVQNRAMASALGISTRRVDSLTFAFASGLAGVAGCIVAFLYGVEVNMGSKYVVESFIVVTLGGMGYTFSSVPGGVVVGTSTGFLSKMMGNEELAKVAVWMLVVVFIMIRPSGLFAAKERSYD